MDPSTFARGPPLDSDFEQALRKLSYRSSPTRQSSLHPAHRVTKLASTGNSPKKVSTRRSTLSSGCESARTGAGSVSGGWQASTITEISKLSVSPRTRPISWHPSSHLARLVTNSVNPTSYFSNTILPQKSDLLQPFTTTQVHGLITPLSQPCYDEPFEQEVFSTLDDPQQYEDPYAFLDEFMGTPEWSACSPFPGVTVENYGYHPHLSHTASMQQVMSTAPPSPESTSVTPADRAPPLLLSKIESATEELVGMGLYDPPSPCAIYTLGSRDGERASIGKGLKLEEFFEPPPPEEDDENEDGDHEMAEETDNEDGAKQPKQQSTVDNDLTTSAAPTWCPPVQATVGGWI